MIRLGEMTPFGTVMKGAVQSSSKPQDTTSHVSDFEKYLLDQHKKTSMKKKTAKKKVTAALGKSKSTLDLHEEEPSVKKSKLHKSQSVGLISETSVDQKSPNEKGLSNRFDEKDKRHYSPREKDFSNYKQRNRRFKLKHQWTGDPNVSDYSDDEEGFDPNDEEWKPDNYLNEEEDGPYGNGIYLYLKSRFG